MTYRIAVIPGDGVGPEITNEAVKVLEAIGETFDKSFQFKQFLAGGCAIDEFGVPMPEKTIDGCRSCEAIHGSAPDIAGKKTAKLLKKTAPFFQLK